MKTILILLDGLGDRSSEILDYKTPLQYANTPNLNKLAEKSTTGLITPYSEGIPLGTEVAHFLLWGYNINQFPGRGLIEALGENMGIDKNAIYLRASLGVVNTNNDKNDTNSNTDYYVKDRRVKNITINEINNLIKDLPKNIDNYTFNLKYSYDVHFILEIKEKNNYISDKISDSDPFYKDRHVMEVQPIKELCNTNEEYNKAKQTSIAINKYLIKCHNILNNHKINIKRKKENKQIGNFILTKWAGKYNKVPKFKDKWGMKSVVIANSALFKGLSKFLNMDYINIGDFEKALKKGLELNNYDFIHIHTKEPDEAGHTKNPKNKVKVIEEIDKKLNLLLNINLEEYLVIITTDHCTPSVGTLIHSGESVPILIYAKNVRIDSVKEFNEISCSNGHLRIYSKDLMNIILNYTDRALLYGLRPNEGNLKYIPNNNFVKKLNSNNYNID